jgi:hypothetical protein
MTKVMYQANKIVVMMVTIWRHGTCFSCKIQSGILPIRIVSYLPYSGSVAACPHNQLSSGYIEELTMPHQNLDADIMVAVSIWLLAVSIFATMLVVALVQVMAENRAKREPGRKTDPAR